MKINHIGLNYFSWVSYWDSKNKESTSDIYELRIYRHQVYRNRYQLVYCPNKRYLYNLILNTDSKEEMKMTLDLMGLRIERITIIIDNNMHDKMILPCSVIDLNKGCK